MAPHSSTLAWKIPQMEEPGRLQSMGSQRLRHDWETSLSLFTVTYWRRKWQPTPMFLPGESQGRRSLGAAIYWVRQSWTRLKQLSSSSSSRSSRVSLDKSETDRKAGDGTSGSHLACHIFNLSLLQWLYTYLHWGDKPNRWHTMFTNLGLGLEHFVFSFKKGRGTGKKLSE